MKLFDSNFQCPACEGALTPLVLGCSSCGCEVKGRFAPQAFSNLSEEDVRFIRLFLHCEGAIRDMERALGVSYPTVKARLADLNRRLNPADPPETPRPLDVRPPEPATVESILRDLETKKTDFKTALAAIKKIKG